RGGGVVVEETICNEAKEYSVEHQRSLKKLKKKKKDDLIKTLPESLTTMPITLDGKKYFDR
ncbi:hypothetical protein INT48_006750, partial [Thamnidium elegans]